MATNIATLISGIQTNRNAIRAKLVELGMVSNTATLDTCARAIEEIINRGAVSATVQEGDTYTIPAGYHNGSGTVSGVSGGGNYNLQSKGITPTKKQQNVTPDSGFYGLSDVTVAPIPDNYQDVSSVTATEGDVLTGKIIVKADGSVVSGDMPNNGTVNQTLDVTTITYTIPRGYHSGTGRVQLVLETKTVTPTKQAQDITPTAGKVLSKVTVEAIPANFIDTTDADAVATSILVDETAYVNGVKVVGTMPNNGDSNKTIDGLTSTSVSIPMGYTTGGTVSLTDDIYNALAAI